VFASCTNLRALPVIADAERALDKTVLASNTVLAWHLARLAGLLERLPGAGRLGALPLPPDPPSARDGFQPGAP
jgi:maleate isomerase